MTFKPHKKFFALLMAATITLGCSATVFAGQSPTIGGIVSPPTQSIQMVGTAAAMAEAQALRWEATYYVTRSLSINNARYATVSVNFVLYDSSYKVDVVATLQRVSGGVTTNVKDFKASGYGSARIDSGHTVTSSGSYWVEIVGTVYDSNGVYVETVTAVSNTVTI